MNAIIAKLRLKARLESPLRDFGHGDSSFQHGARLQTISNGFCGKNTIICPIYDPLLLITKWRVYFQIHSLWTIVRRSLATPCSQYCALYNYNGVVTLVIFTLDFWHLTSPTESSAIASNLIGFSNCYIDRFVRLWRFQPYTLIYQMYISHLINKMGTLRASYPVNFLQNL